MRYNGGGARAGREGAIRETEIHPLLDPKRQEMARRYEREKRLAGLAGTAVSLAALLVFYFAGLSRDTAQVAAGGSIVWTFLAYTAVFLAWMTLIGLPAAFYGGYVLEHKWSFSTENVKGWLADQAKSFAVGLVMAWIVLALLLWIIARFPVWWWLVAGLAMALVGVVTATLFPVVVAPIFHRYTPIDDKELADALRAILAREGLKSGGFFKEDMSRRTRKENAFLAGLGKTRRVVLGDTLIEHMSVPEIVSVIAHEVGHYRYKHIWKGVAAGTLQQLAVFFLLSVVMRALFPAFPGTPREVLTVLPVMLIIGGAASGFVMGPIGNALSRHFEKQADLYAIAHIEDRRAFATALAGLADRNLGNAYPAWWVKMLFYTHPPVGERLSYVGDGRGPGEGATSPPGPA
jgi:STE24 endopeptidase